VTAAFDLACVVNMGDVRVQSHAVGVGLRVKGTQSTSDFIADNRAP